MRPIVRPLFSALLVASLAVVGSAGSALATVGGDSPEATTATAPAPTVSPEPEPAVTPEPTPEPDPEPSVAPEPTPEPEPTVTPEPAPEPDPEPTVTPTPAPSPSVTPKPVLAPATTPTVPAVAAEAPSAAAGVASAALPVLKTVPLGPLAPVSLKSGIDPYASYRGQVTCDPTAKPGTSYLLNLALDYYDAGHSSGIGRSCSVGGTSEHKEGRAFDWAVNAAVPAEKAAGDAFVQWLTAIGPDGKPGYNARRLGVMYIIWNEHIWSNSSSNAQWKDYSGWSAHTDHVHVSLSWAGAYKRTSWWTGVALPSSWESSAYVSRVYSDLFHRSADSSGLATWTTALTDGEPRIAVSNMITSSREYRGGLIKNAYSEFLDRSPDAPGLAGWLGAMNSGMTIQKMEAGFLASPEYYAKAGGDDASWVRQLYAHVLDRPAGGAEVDHWTARLAAGTSRQTVAMGFLISTERLRTVVSGYYLDLLDRGTDPAGRDSWVNAIQHGARTEQIIGGIVASNEYFIKATQSWDS